MNRSEAVADLDREFHRMEVEPKALKAYFISRLALVTSETAEFALLASLVLHLEGVVAWDCETGYTDGNKIYLNPDYFLSLTPAQRIGFVAHEAMHCALRHHARGCRRNQQVWQIAADLATNDVLVDTKVVLPPGALVPGHSIYAHLPRGENAETYYDLLMKDQPPGEGDNPDGRQMGEGQGQGQGDDEQQGQGQGRGKGKGSPGGNGQTGDDEGDGEGEGEGESGEGPGKDQGSGVEDPGRCGAAKAAVDPAEAVEQEMKWDENLKSALEVVKSRGDLSAGLKRMVAEMLKPPKVRWQDELRDFLTAKAKADYSWRKVNRRILSQGITLPGRFSEELGQIVTSIDTSGSISQRELQAYGAELQGICEGFGDVQLTILYHDAAICGVQTWSPGQGPLVLEPVGGGGTSHHPVFEWIRDHQWEMEELVALLCFTDMYSVFPSTEPDYPVLWVATTDRTGPFGRTIRLELNEKGS